MVEWFLFISSIILAAITGLYVWQTRKLVQINQAMLNISNIPNVQVFLTYGILSADSKTVNVCIINMGTGTALDVKFSGNFSSFSSPLTNLTLAEWDILKNGISHLGPNGHWERPMYMWHTSTSDDLPVEILTGTITYTDITKNKYTETFRLNFKHIASYTRTGDQSTVSIANSLLSIDKHLSDIINNINPKH